MKNASTKKKLALKPEADDSILKDKQTLSPKKQKNTMTEQAIMPPARVWDKIEKALDEQDTRRKQGTEVIAQTLSKGSPKQKKQFYFAVVAGVGMIAVLWLAL